MSKMIDNKKAKAKKVPKKIQKGTKGGISEQQCKDAGGDWDKDSKTCTINQ